MFLNDDFLLTNDFAKDLYHQPLQMAVDAGMRSR